MFFPPVSGGRILIYNHVRLLSKFYEVEIVTPDSKDDSPNFPDQGLHAIGKVHYVKFPNQQLMKKPESWGYMLRHYPKAILARYPIVHIYDFYAHPDVQKLIKDDFDVIQLNQSWYYHPELKHRRGKLLLVSQNYEYEYWRGMAKALFHQKEYIRGVSYWLGSGKIFHQEQEAMGEADGVLALSERECRIFNEVYRLKGKCHAVNPGIDISSCRESQRLDTPSDTKKTLDLIYVGSLNAPQNADGLISFIKEIYPILKKLSPFSCRLILVGGNPVAALQKLAKEDPSIVLTGLVDDVKPWIKKSDIYIVPLKHGSGIRFKIMEAMAMGKPVISTRKGAEGLDVEGAGVIIVDKFQDFVEAILSLTKDRKLLLQMEQTNIDFANKNFDCEKIFHDKILPIYRAMINT